MSDEKTDSEIPKKPGRGGARPGTGGRRPGSGRKPGQPNKKTAARIAEIEASGMTPLEYMLSVLRDDGAEPARRLAAATAAAPYVHSRLSTVEHAGPGKNGAIIIEISAEDEDL